MFGLLKNRVPKPELLEVEEVVEVSEEYKKLATKLGVLVKEDPETSSKKFEAFLTQSGIRVYPWDKVNKFLWAEANKARDRWTAQEVIWRPLTKEDQSRSNIYGKPVYDKPVPYPVLLRVEQIKEAFPSATFFVSDYKAVDPDPFLAVHFAGTDYVVEHWDEPGFLPFLNNAK